MRLLDDKSVLIVTDARYKHEALLKLMKLIFNPSHPKTPHLTRKPISLSCYLKQVYELLAVISVCSALLDIKLER